MGGHCCFPCSSRAALDDTPNEKKPSPKGPESHTLWMDFGRFCLPWSGPCVALSGNVHCSSFLSLWFRMIKSIRSERDRLLLTCSYFKRPHFVVNVRHRGDIRDGAMQSKREREMEREKRRHLQKKGDTALFNLLLLGLTFFHIFTPLQCSATQRFSRAEEKRRHTFCTNT